MERILKISIDYSKLETVIKIDIEQRTELSIIPTFSVEIVDCEFSGNLDLNEYLNDLFDKNFTTKPEHNNQYSIKEIYGQNQSRKILFINSQRKELDRFVSLKLGNEVLNLSKFSKSYDNLVKLSETEFKVNFSRIFSTYILDIDSLERITDRNEREIFTVLFDFENFRKFKRTFIRQKLVLLMHSNRFDTFKRSTKNLDKSVDDYEFEKITAPMIYKLIGTKQQFIENGKEICSHYKSNDRPFNAFSQSVCLRKCYQNYCQKRFSCSPLVIKEMISSIDEQKNEMQFCSQELNDFCEKAINEINLSKECAKYCPKDCIQFDIQLSKIIVSPKKTDSLTHKTELVWDKNYPLIAYIETRVMTFTDYLCYCGGLFGLWFGSNANSVLNYASNPRNWISLKDKLFNLCAILLSMIWKTMILFLNFLSRLHFRKEIKLSIDSRAGKLKLEWT
jgi:hypothetical protein